MEFQLNEEQKMWRDVVHNFCQKEVAPRAAQTDHEAKTPMDIIKKMAPIGLLGLPVPEEDDGPGLDYVSIAIAIEELGRACGSTALSIAAHSGLGLNPIIRWGTAEQKAKYIPQLMSGDYLGSLALTEPSAGSDLVNGVKTKAVLDGDTWVINGSKAWITNPSFSSFITTLCRTDENARTRGFSMIIVEVDREGLIISPPEKKMGLKGSPTNMLSYDNVRVPKENLLGEEGRGLHQALATLDVGRITIGAMAVGLAFGKPIGQHQSIQNKIADMATLVEASRLLVYQSAWLKGNDKPFTTQAAMAKLFASEASEKAAFEAIQIHGGYGYSPEYPVERIYRDQRLLSIGEGTNEILRMVIGRKVLAGE
ncbi:MAG: acyl-CoA dehydrogenase [Anaerolineaceae bacterium 4572_78]|nr:MAG: acyl-CoA dehydrogenase [Anaerolineaceae bacterium 4572_78]